MKKCLFVLLLLTACGAKVNERGETPCQEKARLEQEAKFKQDSVRIIANYLEVEKKKVVEQAKALEARAIPSITAFTVGQRVCIIDIRKSGTVTEIDWDDAGTMLTYTVEYYEDEFTTYVFYESQLNPGGC